MSNRLYSTLAIHDSPISTHQIKSLSPSFNDCFFLPQSERSMFYIEKSLCQQEERSKGRVNKGNLLSKDEKEIVDRNNNCKSTFREQILEKDASCGNGGGYVNHEDVSKLYSQLISKGKKIEALLKTLLARDQPSAGLSKLQAEKIAQSSSYLKSSAQMILNEYYKKRKLGQKLRGLNSDLLAEIEAKLFPLIQTQLKIWHSKKQNQKIQSQFEEKSQKFGNQLKEIQQKQLK